MRKLAKLFLLLSLVAVLASSLCVMASASTDTVTTFNQLYIGDYEQDSDKYTGMAHVVFGTVSNTNTEFGILIEAADGKTYKFPGRVIADSGKFGVAIYQLPEGNYKASAYSGTDDNRIVGEPATFTANKATYTLSFDVSKTAGVTAPSVQTVAQGTAGEKPTVTIPDSAPANSDVAWITDEGKLFDFDAVLTADTTVYAQWVASEELGSKTWTLSNSGALGNNVGVDLSDGSTLNMEFDILDSSLSASNYNYYIWLRKDTNYGTWSNYVAPYGNYNFFSPWTTHWTAGGVTNTSSADLTLSTGCNVTTMYAKNQSVKVSYTAPTESTTGSVYWYVKAIGSNEWTTLWSATGITLNHVFDTSNVFMGIHMDKATNYITFNNFRMYVNDGEYNIPAFSNKSGALAEYVPSYTVTYMNGTSSFSTETVEEGNTATAPDTSSLSVPLGGVYTWVDANGDEFDFNTAIEKDTTLYFKAIADPQVKQNTYSVNVTSTTKSLHLMTSVPADLSAGDTLYLEMDVISSSLRNWHNCYVGFNFWQYLPSRDGAELSGEYVLGSFHDTAYINNPIHWHQENTGNYTGIYSHVDHSGADPVKSGEFNPAVAFADGKTVRMAYTAPTDTTNGSIMLYNKDIGADDSTYVLISSVTDLVKDSTVTTNSTYAGLCFYTFSSSISITFTNYHVYTEAYGDIPAMFDYKNDGTELTLVS